MIKTRRLYTIGTDIFLMLWLFLVAACSEERIQEHPASEFDELPVTVSALAGGQGYATRAGEAEKPEVVRDREMLFTYPSQPSGEMKSAICVFDEQGYGFVYADSEKKSQLRWKDIYTEEGDYSVYLDNLVNYPVRPKNEVNILEYRADNFEQIEFWSEDSTKTDLDHNYGHKAMIAPEGSEEALEKDIIWGKLDNPEIGQSLPFKLTHKMSKLTFRFTGEDEEIKDKLGKGNIKVWLDDISIVLFWGLTPSQFDGNRNYYAFRRDDGGIYGQGQRHGFTYIYLVGDQKISSVPELEVPKNLVASENGSYSTPAWIFPPLYFRDGTISPRLSLQFGGEPGETFSGKLPATITSWKTDDEGNMKEVKEPLRFSTGVHLLINVRINKTADKRELLFQNIEVVPWTVSFDEDNTASESGIYTWDDLVSLVDIFNEDSSEQNYRLMKYGQWDGNKWKFKLWKNIEVDDSMLPLPEFKSEIFEIDFTGYRIIVGSDIEIKDENYKDYLVEKTAVTS